MAWVVRAAMADVPLSASLAVAVTVGVPFLAWLGLAGAARFLRGRAASWRARRRLERLWRK